MLVALAQEVILAWGWKRRFIALLSGAAGALALAPVDFLPAMMIPMVCAVWLIDGCVRETGNSTGHFHEKFIPVVDAAIAGWWMGFGYFVAGLWWLGAAFLVEVDQFAWALPLGVLGLPAILACFFAFGFGIARLLWSPGAARVFALVAGLAAAEWLRGNILTGFPWNALGMSLAGNIVSGQIGSLVGLYGMTILAIAIFATPATLADLQVSKRTKLLGLTPTLIAFMATALILGFGTIRLSGLDAGMVPGVKLRIVQPNLLQDEKFRPENRDQILRTYLSVSDRATSPISTGIGDVTHLVWPESAFPFILSRDPEAVRRIAGSLSGRTILITGAARQEAPAAGQTRARFFNSIELVSADGLLPEFYDKRHLVPFGEYLPFSALLEKLRLRQFVHIPGGFDPGIGPGQLQIPGLPLAAPLICYEAIFPEAIGPDSPRVDLLLNVTNDGWFGLTTGPYQHLAQARLRSIEQGVPMIRAANTGISAMIDPYGRIIGRIALGTQGVLDSGLPKSIKPTLFAQFPNLIPLSMWLFTAIFALFGVIRAYRR